MKLYNYVHPRRARKTLEKLRGLHPDCKFWLENCGNFLLPQYQHRWLIKMQRPDNRTAYVANPSR